MLDRTHDSSWIGTLRASEGVHLNSVERAMTQWATVDDYDSILQLECENTNLLKYFSQKFVLRAYGTCNSSDVAKQLRKENETAEILCTGNENTTIRSNSIDAVFYQTSWKKKMNFRSLTEAFRVIKGGGQMMIAVTGIPEALRRVADFLGITRNNNSMDPRGIMIAMENAGFTDVSFRNVFPFVGLAMGWKRELE